MNWKDLLYWLKEKDLLDTVIKYYPHFKNILEKNLFIKDEPIIIIADLGRKGKRIPAIAAACYLLAAKELKKNVELIIQGPKFRGDRASEEIVEKFLDLGNHNILILCMSGKLGSLKAIGKSFRKYVRQKKHKFISLSGLNYTRTELFPSILSTMTADPEKMEKRAKKLKKKLDKAKTIELKTDKGTDLKVNKEGVEAVTNAGIYKEFGKGGNLPAGEVYFHPLGKENVSGKAVIDGSIRTHRGTVVLRSPITINIEKGSITSIEGGKEAETLRETIDWAEKKAKVKENVRKIGEIGIGINPNARIINPTMIDEKTYLTAHIANGSNHWFGGPIKSAVHFDHVMRDIKIFADGKLLKY
ncbi:MAG: aminopeptidase [Nanobdellota archaeon]